ncbi:hypothetical protein HYALB_00000082 [Hymenoscyphus albidus]|uniref:2EXR domain-containing protein n=1 Tax=Hymenoscyphus albidus TaxID=595503 RepID=A0A9N9Q318_9HELO|nr:hypothetical protein HYALB_00000082 [Hymenoscyphus albidus]
MTRENRPKTKKSSSKAPLPENIGKVLEETPHTEVLPKFEKFCQLPAELRLMIWKFADDDKSHSRVFTLGVGGMGTWRVLPSSPLPLLSRDCLEFTCQEARNSFEEEMIKGELEFDTPLDIQYDQLVRISRARYACPGPWKLYPLAFKQISGDVTYEESDPRVFEATPAVGRYIPFPTRQRTDSDRGTWQVQADNKLTLLAVCKESRYALLKRFVAPFHKGKTMTCDVQGIPHVVNLLFDPRRDVLSFWCEMYRAFFTTDILEGGYEFGVGLDILQDCSIAVDGPWTVRPLEIEQVHGDEGLDEPMQS